LDSLRPEQAKELIEKTYDLALLNRWKELSSVSRERKPLRKLIDSQLQIAEAKIRVMEKQDEKDIGGKK